MVPHPGATTRFDELRPVRRGESVTRRLRPLNEPRPLRVETDRSGDPRTVSVERRRRGVEVIRETWRIDDEWWRRPISRLYHAVVLEGGRPLVLYEDLVDGGWYAQD